jgi:hypothetical protein
MATGGSTFPNVNALKAILADTTKYEGNAIELAVQRAVGDLGAASGVVDNVTATTNLAKMGTVDVTRAWVQGASAVDFVKSAIVDTNLILVLAAGLAGRPFAYPLLYMRRQLAGNGRYPPGTAASASAIVALATDFHAIVNGTNVAAKQQLLEGLYSFDRSLDDSDNTLITKLLPRAFNTRFFTANTWKDPKSPNLPIFPFNPMDPIVVPIIVDPDVKPPFVPIVIPIHVIPNDKPGPGPPVPGNDPSDDPSDDPGGHSGGGGHTDGGHTGDGNGGGGRTIDRHQYADEETTGVRSNDVSKDNSMPIIIVLILFACIILFIVARKGQ